VRVVGEIVKGALWRAPYGHRRGELAPGHFKKIEG
jgi:hypothetical protein